MTPSKHLTPELIQAVNAYLMAKAYAQVMRERVDAVHREILTECPIYADRDEGQQILRSHDLYLCSNEALCADFFAEANHRLRKLGIKPADMADNHCPALVAENLVCKTANFLADVSGRPFGVTAHKLLCAGMAKFDEWIELNCKFVVNSPGYKAPKFP